MTPQKKSKATSLGKRKPKPKPPEEPIDVPPLILARMPELLKGILDGSITLLVNQQKRLSNLQLNELVKQLQDKGAQILINKEGKEI